MKLVKLVLQAAVARSSADWFSLAKKSVRPVWELTWRTSMSVHLSLLAKMVLMDFLIDGSAFRTPDRSPGLESSASISRTV